MSQSKSNVSVACKYVIYTLPLVKPPLIAPLKYVSVLLDLLAKVLANNHDEEIPQSD